MLRSIRKLLLVLVVAWIPLLASTEALARGTDRAGPRGAEKAEIDRLLDEWSRLTPEQKREKFRLYEERWKRLPSQERARRLRLFEERLKDRSPEEVSELLRRLKHLKQRTDLQALREKQRRMKEIVRGILAAGPDGLRARVRRLPPHHRGVVDRFAVSRLYEEIRRAMLASLTAKEAELLKATDVKARRGALKTLVLKKILAALPEAERNAIQALPEKQRRARIEAHFRRAQEARMREVRGQVAEEIAALVRSGPAELDRRARSHRIRRLLKELDVKDPGVANALTRMPWSRLRVVLDQLRRARTPEERREVLKGVVTKPPR